MCLLVIHQSKLLILDAAKRLRPNEEPVNSTANYSFGHKVQKIDSESFQRQPNFSQNPNGQPPAVPYKNMSHV